MKLFLPIFIFLNFAVAGILHAATTVTVDKNGTGDFATVQAAVDFMNMSDDTAEKFSSTGQSAYPASGDYVLGIGTSWATDIAVGDYFSFDELTWYEVKEVLNDMEIRLSRNHELVPHSGLYPYKVVEANTIEIKPGSYEESVDLNGLHFLTVKGTATREATVIFSQLLDPQVSEFKNLPTVGAINFKSLTMRNPSGGYGHISGGGANLRFSMDDVVLDNAVGADNIITTVAGAVTISNSLILGAVDGVTFGNSLKYFGMENTTIYDRWNGTLPMGGRALRIYVSLDSFIKNSKIIMEGSLLSGESIAVKIFGTNGAKIDIINSKLTALNGARALWVQSGNVVVNNSILTVSGGSNDYHIELDNASNITLNCTDGGRILNNGGIVTETCQ